VTSDDYTDDERTADVAYRALVDSGLLPRLVSGERFGQSYRPFALQIGKMTEARAAQAREVVDDAIGGTGYHAALEVDWSRASERECDAYCDNDAPIHWVIQIALDE